MKDLITSELLVRNKKVRVIRNNNQDYISLTDLARYADSEEPKIPIQNWMRNKDVILYLGLWEKLNNYNFKGIEFDTFEKEAGRNSFRISPQKWIKSTGAIGIISKSGNNGGTFAHSDIAFEFASWLSPEFKLYLIQEFQRLKKNEAYQNKIDWHANIINIALFGMTAKEWRDNNPNLEGNIRDYTDIVHLVILSNLENINSELVKQGLSQIERLIKLNEIARNQMKLFFNNASIKQLKN